MIINLLLLMLILIIIIIITILLLLILLLLLLFILLFYYIKYLQNLLIKSLNVNDEITIFIIILNLYYNEKIIYKLFIMLLLSRN